jgi:hypothetical protein
MRSCAGDTGQPGCQVWGTSAALTALTVAVKGATEGGAVVVVVGGAVVALRVVAVAVVGAVVVALGTVVVVVGTEARLDDPHPPRRATVAEAATASR